MNTTIMSKIGCRLQTKQVIYIYILNIFAEIPDMNHFLFSNILLSCTICVFEDCDVVILRDVDLFVFVPVGKNVEDLQ